MKKMLPKYADIIIDISHEAIDRTFQYRIPEQLANDIGIGTQVSIPFGRGNHLRKGYVVSFSEQPIFAEDKIKEIDSIVYNSVAIESSMIELAAFIKERYGSTMINALKTVMPVKEKMKSLVKKEVRLLVDRQQATELLGLYERKHAVAKLRLLQELMDENILPYELVTGKLNISSPTLKSLEKDQVIAIEQEGYYRNVFSKEMEHDKQLNDANNKVIPNEEQQKVIHKIMEDYESGKNETFLLKGITGSGKTLVYIELIERVLASGKQAIVLIPEIALTFQTVKRFRSRFGDQVTIMNSRLSKGERYDQFEKAKNGQVSVMIGPRSALFAPFPNLGIIIIDEEHEATYKSEYPPKYHAREVAIHRGKMTGAMVVLGSATPSVDSYYRAKQGEYGLLTLAHRAKEGANLAKVSVVDLREELKMGNRSIFSSHLQTLMTKRLQKGEQIMLFLNRRGSSGFVSCRSCGYVFRCEHCDISLTEHFAKTPRAKLVCHYCGYEQKRPQLCPKCQSKAIAGFGIGTQKVEEEARQLFPNARILRMDMDTTRTKDAHEKLLSQFANGEADILVGTQMIVKGHDFSNVTLVGVIAADLTMFDNDYMSGERTFCLLTQAAGRAGRGELPGEVVIQTYNPEHYVIETAAKQDYEEFYSEERAYRNLLQYPPFVNVLVVFLECENYDQVVSLSNAIKTYVQANCVEQQESVRIIGPSDATIARVNDLYRRAIYFKSENYQDLIDIKDRLEEHIEHNSEFEHCYVSFDFNPLHAY